MKLTNWYSRYSCQVTIQKLISQAWIQSSLPPYIPINLSKYHSIPMNCWLILYSTGWWKLKERTWDYVYTALFVYCIRWCSIQMSVKNLTFCFLFRMMLAPPNSLFVIYNFCVLYLCFFEQELCLFHGLFDFSVQRLNWTDKSNLVSWLACWFINWLITWNMDWYIDWWLIDWLSC